MAAAATAWGLVTLRGLPAADAGPPPAADSSQATEHLLILLDVSPSMQIRDAGPSRDLSRQRRAGVLLEDVLAAVSLERTRVSVVAVYNGALPAVIDTRDRGILGNLLNDLPLDFAFQPGKTRLIDGLREAAELARHWAPGSTTVLMVSDGDTVPDTGMPPMPPAVRQVILAGVGDAQGGKFIDGHLSRQDAAGLRQIAARLGGTYVDGNVRGIPEGLGIAVPSQGGGFAMARPDRRDAALMACAAGALLLASLPLALAFAGGGWQRADRPPRRSAP
jgi:Ca-activated chloride channel family protein